MREPVRVRRAGTTADDGYVAAVMVSAAVGLVLRSRRWPRRPVRALVAGSSPALLATPLPLSGGTGCSVPLAPPAAVSGARLGRP